MTESQTVTIETDDGLAVVVTADRYDTWWPLRSGKPWRVSVVITVDHFSVRGELRQRFSASEVERLMRRLAAEPTPDQGVKEAS